MEASIAYVAGLIWDIPLIVAIMTTGLYFTYSTRLFQLRFLPGSFQGIIRSFFQRHRDDEDTSIQPEEAFFVSLGTTVGIGSVVGVAMAVVVGGVGTIFWMWVSSVVGMIIKTAEVTLTTYYRNEEEQGICYGSPMDYMEKGIGKNMHMSFWYVPAFVFGCGVLATSLITLQNYEVSRTVYIALSIDPLSVAMAYATLTYICIYNGIKGYKKIAYRLIPLVLIAYVGCGFLVLVKNASMLGPCIQAIFQEAFQVKAAFGGIMGRGLVEVISQGMSIALFTNEAGWGTTPMLYSRARTDHPVRMGLLSALEVFIVSMVVCSTTALVVAVAGQYQEGMSVTELVLLSFATGIGSGANIIIPLILLIFGVTTTAGWYLYYEVIIRGFHRKIHRKVEWVLHSFKLIYPLLGMWIVFYSVQMQIPASVLWNIMAITMGIPVLINIFSILILSNKFFELVQDYVDRLQGKSTEDIEPVPIFYWQEKDYYNGWEEEMEEGR